MILAKVHTTPEGQSILAACDADIKGKVYEEGAKILDLTSGFYGGEEVSDERLKKLLVSSNILNLCGEETLHKATEAGVVDKEAIVYIDRIPHVQIAFY